MRAKPLVLSATPSELRVSCQPDAFLIPRAALRNKQNPLPPKIMAAAAAAAGAASATVSTTPSANQEPMNALRAAALRLSAPHWSAAAAAAASFFSPPFRPRRCRCRGAPAPAAATRTPRSRAGAKARAKLLLEAEPRDPWFASLSLLPADGSPGADAAPNGWAIGVDPDTGGAIAVLSPDGSSQVRPAAMLELAIGSACVYGASGC
jgi:hypothetical protein